MKIYVDLTGRIGNQMFQYAVARYIQEINNATIVLNDHFLTHYTDFKEELSSFILNDKVIFSNEKLPTKADRLNIFNRSLNKLSKKAISKIKQKENVLYWYGNTFLEYDLDFNKDIYITGYFQSDLYFPNMNSILRQEFRPKNLTVSEDFLEIIKKIESSDSVCVTIRRGNYLSNKKFKKKYFVADKEYFDRSIKYLKEKKCDLSLFLFSDEIDWLKKTYKDVFIEPENLTIQQKIYAMSKCKYFIISNSSFSWWVQYLSNNNNKIVIAPQKWYASGEKTDIYQENWIRM